MNHFQVCGAFFIIPDTAGAVLFFDYHSLDETGFIKVTIWTYLSVSYGYFTNYFVHHYPKFWGAGHKQKNLKSPDFRFWL